MNVITCAEHFDLFKYVLGLGQKLVLHSNITSIFIHHFEGGECFPFSPLALQSTLLSQMLINEMTGKAK